MVALSTWISSALALRKRRIASNPMDFVDLPEGSTRRKEKPRSLMPTEFLALLKLFEPRERLAVEIAGWLGTRCSEGFGLKWQDLDLDRCVVTFRQGFVSGRISQLKTEVRVPKLAFRRR